MNSHVIFDSETMTVDLTNIALSLPFEEIEKHALTHPRRACRTNFVRQDYDIKIVTSTQSERKSEGINISFGNPIFTKYDFIDFFVFRDMLFFKLSNSYTDTRSYKITRNDRRNGMAADTEFLCAKVAGEGYDKLKPFEGCYTMAKYTDLPYEPNDEEVFFITKPYSIV